VCVLLPRAYERLQHSDVAAEFSIAEAAEVEVIPLEYVYNDVKPAELVIATWDNRLNVFGHRLIAKDFY